MYGNYAGWGWMMILMPLLWVGLIAVIVWAVVRFAGQPAGSTPPRETPQEILDRRLATGEIDLDTYTSANEHLSARGTGPR